MKPASSFRDRAAYSNVGFFLAGELAAKAGGQPFEELVRTLLFRPLALTRTDTASFLIGPDPGRPGALEDVSRSHALVGGRLQVVPPNLSAVFVAAGGFASSASDLGRFVTLLARGGEIGGRRVLSEAAVMALFEPVIAEEPGFAEFPPIDADSGFDYSPGWGVYHYNGWKVLEKSGALDGVRTLLPVVPQKRFAVAILARARRLERQVLAVEPRPSNPRPPSRPLAAYSGTNGNDLFGAWKEVEREGALEVLAAPARYRAALSAWNGETFRLLWPGLISSPVDVPFRTDPGGRVSGFEYQGCDFRRVDSRALNWRTPYLLHQLLHQPMTKLQNHRQSMAGIAAPEHDRPRLRSPLFSPGSPGGRSIAISRFGEDGRTD